MLLILPQHGGDRRRLIAFVKGAQSAGVLGFKTELFATRSQSSLSMSAVHAVTWAGCWHDWLLQADPEQGQNCATSLFAQSEMDDTGMLQRAPCLQSSV
jgi:hypothetical protein